MANLPGLSGCCWVLEQTRGLTTQGPNRLLSGCTMPRPPEAWVLGTPQALPRTGGRAGVFQAEGPPVCDSRPLHWLFPLPGPHPLSFGLAIASGQYSEEPM